MSNDLGARADDYERRLDEAGGTDTVMGSLVVSDERRRNIIKWLMISIAFDVFLSFGFGFLAFYAQHNANTASETAKLAVVAAKVACDQSAKNSVVTNELINQLIDNIRLSDQLTPAEKEQRIEDYEKLIIIIPDCANPEVDVEP